MGTNIKVFAAVVIAAYLAPKVLPMLGIPRDETGFGMDDIAGAALVVVSFILVGYLL
jgi:hypothetical protein